MLKCCMGLDKCIMFKHLQLQYQTIVSTIVIAEPRIEVRKS